MRLPFERRPVKIAALFGRRNQPVDINTALRNTVKSCRWHVPVAILLVLVVLIGGATFAGLAADSLEGDEEVLFLPGLAYRNAQAGWVVTLRGYVFEPEFDSLRRRAVLASLRKALGPDDDVDEEDSTSCDGVADDDADNPYFQRRARLFLVDHERGKRVRVYLKDRLMVLPESRSGGQLRGSFLLPGDVFRRELLAGRNPTIPFTVPMGHDRPAHRAPLHVVEPLGVSVISDIDDTIKISDVLNKRELICRTFFREFEAVPGLAKIYAEHARAGVSFHYVSGSPWQLYPELSKFLKHTGFPDGSFHLRELRLKSIVDFATADPLAYKVDTISDLLNRLPRREFVLIGDSGEKDPEVYAEIARKYRRQVRAILIRDVRAPGEIDERIATLRKGLPGLRFIVFRDASELRGVRF